MIKMKLLKIERVKDVWNKKAANKMKLTIIKSENNWLNEIHNSFDKLDKLTEIAWEIQKKKVLFSEREGESLLKETKRSGKMRGNKRCLLQTRRIVYIEFEK